MSSLSLELELPSLCPVLSRERARAARNIPVQILSNSFLNSLFSHQRFTSLPRPGISSQSYSLLAYRPDMTAQYQEIPICDADADIHPTTAMADFPTSDDPIGPHSNGDLVYVGMDTNGNKSLRVHVSGPSLPSKTAPQADPVSEPRDDVYVIIPQSTVILRQPREDMERVIVTELGWFANPALFQFICMNQPVRKNLQSVLGNRFNLIFDDWVLDVLETIGILHSTFWCPA
ncbi:hypothetical protein BKA63DRAFT_490894 [Paraphoma chrysanthemicola]|nr:hypothetical protein BKA63DRAFT_490894 [Paraphoma chrysanthemicola]